MQNNQMQEQSTDYIVRGLAAGGQVRAFAVTGKELVEYARKRHETSPVMTAALGRFLCAGAMMGVMMKGEKDVLTMIIRSTGPAKGMTVTANSHGQVKGYPIVNDVMLPANALGKLDVGGAIGPGQLRVIKDLGLKEPYVGTIELQSGEIAEDLTYYFVSSEQIPSSVGLGVLMNKDNTVRQAGGFILQLMPGTTDETIDKLEEVIRQMPTVTQLLDAGHTPESMLSYLLGDLGLEITEKIPAAFACDCSREKVEKVLYGIGKEELASIVNEGQPVHVQCHFCNTFYDFTLDEVKAIAARA